MWACTLKAISTITKGLQLGIYHTLSKEVLQHYLMLCFCNLAASDELSMHVNRCGTEPGDEECVGQLRIE